MSNRLGSRKRNEVELWRSLPTFPPSGTRLRRLRGIVKKSYGFSLSELWSMFSPTLERAEVTITWRGSQTTRHEIVRSVSRYESLGEYDRMMDRIVQLRLEGLTIKQLAAQLTREGYRTPRSQKGYTSTSVRQLLSRRGLTGGVIGREQLGSRRMVAA